MYAVVEVGAKQYAVKTSDIIEVEKQEGEAGKEIALDKVLLVSSEDSIEVGKPYLKNARVDAVILGQVRGEKVVSYKYRRRKASHWKKGHRQQLTRIKISGIIPG